jgi:hypothetical protein
MKSNVTTMARMLVFLMGLAVIVVCAILLPELAREEAVGKINPTPAYPFLIGAWVLSAPIFAALHQTLKLLGYLENKTAFATYSVTALKNIKYSSITFSALVVIGTLLTIIWGKSIDPTEDVTPILSLGFIFAFISGIIATFVAVLQHLLHQAIEIQSENDLTI